MKKPIFIFLLIISSLSLLKAQHVVEMDFDSLKPLLEKQNDTVYVINFWATWCKPCIEELPYFLKAAKEFKHQKVKFIFVSLDFPKQKTSRLIPFVKKHHINEQVILLNDPNSNKWINQVNPKWSGAIPATVVYKSSNKSFIEGSISYNELIQTIKSKMP